ncbi:MAG: beta strand repeat-containing protein [Cyanobium sp.]
MAFIVGTSLDDRLKSSNDSFDVINGLAGSDTVDYSDAMAAVKVSLALTGAQNTGGSGFDVLISIENIFGSQFSDSLTGDAGNNTLNGGEGFGNDTLDGGLGNDVLNGGLGQDAASYSGAAGSVTVSLENGFAFGAAGRDTISGIEDVIGSNFADHLTGSNRDSNIIEGRDGDDTIGGSNGNDVLSGGDGFDTVDYGLLAGPVTLRAFGVVDKRSLGVDQLISVEAILGSRGLGDTVDHSQVGAPATGTTTNLTTGVVVVGGTSPLPLTFVVSQFENVIGSRFADTVFGNTSANNISSGEGNDTIFGTNGNDIIDGGLGTDIANYSSLGSVVTLGAFGGLNKGLLGTDSLIGIETIVGSSLFGDTVDLSAAGAPATGTTANLTIGVVTVNGTTAPLPLTFRVSQFENVIGSGSADAITGDRSSNALSAGSGNDTIFGTLGNDTINGGRGTDVVNYSSLGSVVSLGAFGIVQKLRGFTQLQQDLAGVSSIEAPTAEEFGGMEGILFIGIDDSFEAAPLGIDTLIGIETIIGSRFLGDVVDLSGAGSPATGSSVNLTTGVVTVNGPTAPLPLSFTVSQFENVIGTNFADVITGNGGNNSIQSGGDNDMIFGSSGSDAINTGLGIDTVSYSSLGSVVTLDAVGNVKKRFGTDKLTGFEEIVGSVLLGDTLDLSAPNAFISRSVADLSTGVVKLESTTFSSSFKVSQFENVVGSASVDRIFGNNSNNSLAGGAGNDLLAGFVGNDTLSGGAQADSFIFAEFGLENRDLIIDFNSFDDRIVLADALDSTLKESVTSGILGLFFDGGDKPESVLNASWFFKGEGFSGDGLGDLSGIYVDTKNGDIFYNESSASGSYILANLGVYASSALTNLDFVYGA